MTGARLDGCQKFFTIFDCGLFTERFLYVLKLLIVHQNSIGLISSMNFIMRPDRMPDAGTVTSQARAILTI